VDLKIMRSVRTILIAAFAGVFIGINAVAYMQARAMTCFSSDGVRTPRLSYGTPLKVQCARTKVQTMPLDSFANLAFGVYLSSV
jgi:hypothetical protein